MSRQLRITVMLIAVIAATFILGYGVAAQFTHHSFAAPGQTRYAYAAAADPQETTSTSFINIPGLSTGITIPSGKSADLAVTFSGELNGCTFIDVRAVVDGSAFQPAQAQMFYPVASSSAEGRSFTFFRRNVPAGGHTVALQWEQLASCSGNGHSFIGNRSLLLTANIH